MAASASASAGAASPVAAGVVLGASLAGFFDGIVFHQLLEWHHMLSGVPSLAGDLRVQVLADGVFHAVTWVAALVGLALLWRAREGLGAPGGGRTLAGAMLLGAGGFNLVEGVVDHHLLGLHHVHPTAAHPLAWDLGFLAVGLALALAGWGLVRAGRRLA